MSVMVEWLGMETSQCSSWLRSSRTSSSISALSWCEVEEPPSSDQCRTTLRQYYTFSVWWPLHYIIKKTFRIKRPPRHFSFWKLTGILKWSENEMIHYSVEMPPQAKQSIFIFSFSNLWKFMCLCCTERNFRAWRETHDISRRAWTCSAFLLLVPVSGPGPPRSSRWRFKRRRLQEPYISDLWRKPQMWSEAVNNEQDLGIWGIQCNELVRMECWSAGQQRGVHLDDDQSLMKGNLTKCWQIFSLLISCWIVLM